MNESGDAKRLFLEALDFIDSSNFGEAERRLHEAMRLSPANAAILTNLSVVSLQQDKRVEAREYARRAIAVSPRNVEALLVLADCDTRDENFTQALAAYDKVAQLDPKIAQAHNNRGIVLQKLRRHADALASYDSAIAVQSDFAGAHINRGNTLRQLKRRDEALAAYDTALALNGNLHHAWLGRGNVSHDLQRHDEALAAYDKALALSPDLGPAFLGRGNALSALRRYEDALGAYEKALALAPDLAEVWLGRGNVFRELRHYDKALAAYDRTLALKSDLAAAWFGRGNVSSDRKRYDEALAAYDKALAIDPDLTSAWLGRGDTLRLLRRARESIEAYRQALKLGGEVSSIRYYLAALGAEAVPAAMPERFAAALFDSYADHFEHDLIENLKYRTPTVLADTIKRYASPDSIDILDMGCGTGLMGEQIRPLARSLTGVDLSSNMLEKARQRQIYDHLFCCDLIEFFQRHDPSFDLVVATDVFIYVGDLSAVFREVRRALRASGLFGFSVEATNAGDFVLQTTLRYAHSTGYLQRLAQLHHFTIELIEPQVIRLESGANVNGYHAIMRCA